jgi:hypothetical protein
VKAELVRTLWAGLLLVSGCRLTTDYEGTRYLCPDGECPDGQECVDGRCAAEGTTVDASVGCDERFGAESGYELCLEEAQNCRFFVSQTCDEVCRAHGAICLSAEDAESVTPCQNGGDLECTGATSRQMCTCKREPDTSCADQFGAVKGYQLCDETAETCRFYNEARTCGEICTAAGSDCLLTQDADRPDECTPLSDHACTTEFGSQMCTCRR